MLKKINDDNLDVTGLNQIIKTGNKLIRIVYFMAIICLILLGTYLIKEWSILKYIGELLMLISPLFIGFLIAWFFDPFVSWLEEKKVPRILGCIIVYLFILGMILSLFYLFIPSLVSQIKDFVSALPDIFDSVTSFVFGIIENFDANHYIDTVSLKKDITSSITEIGIDVGKNLPNYLFDFGKNIISGGINIVFGLMLGFYLLFDFSKFNRFILLILPKKWEDDYVLLVDRLNSSLRNYIQGLLLVMLLVFITQTIGLTLAGMEAPILFALFCAVTDVIPYFGPYIGAIPAIIVGFTISPITGIFVIISILVVQMLENNFYQPLIMGHTMKLHPVVIMIGLLVFQHFFGIIGMIIATPCIACLKVISVFILERSGFKDKFSIDKKALKELEKSEVKA